MKRPSLPLIAESILREGRPITCATCIHMWQARDRKSDSCGQTSCRGPLWGGDFASYKGPLRAFEAWCFRCGDSSTHGVQVNSRVFGMCDEHAKWFQEAQENSPELPRLPVQSNGKIALTTKNLAQTIFEVEKYYADKEGREL
jgi:hypothetical protein